MPTPTTCSPLNVYEGASVDDLNQLLGTHAPIVIYDNATPFIGASLVGDTTPVAPLFQYYQELISSFGQPLSVDQPITMSGTVLDRIELPISVMSGIGQDVLVGLFADDGSNSPTGLPLAQTYVPKELIPLAGTNLPGHGLMMSKAWTPQSTMTPPAPYDTTTGAGFASDGVVAIFVGGYNATFVAASVTIIGLMSPDNGTVTQWNPGPAYPLPIAEPAVAVDNASYVYVAGGVSAGSIVTNNGVYSALYTSTPPSIGAWSPQTVLPQALTGNAAIVISSGTTSGAAPILYSVGGLHSGHGATNAVYAAPITSPGLIGLWTTPAGSQFPTPITVTTLVEINGYLVAIGGETETSGPTYTANVWAAKINADNTIGSWTPWTSLPWAYAGVACVLGNTIVYTGQQQAWSLDVSMLGQPDPTWQNCSQRWSTIAGAPQDFPVACCITGNYLMNFAHPPGGSGIVVTPGSTPLNFVTEMSVPLHATGLTNAAKYHIVVSPLGNCDQFNVTQIAMSSTAPTASYAAPIGVAGDGGVTSGFNILPSYMSYAANSGWDTPNSGRFTNNCVVTYAGGEVIMTSINSGAMQASTFNNDDGASDTSGRFAVPVIPGALYFFACSFKCATTPQTILLELLFCDINGNYTGTAYSSEVVDSVGGTGMYAWGVAPANAAYATMLMGPMNTAAAGEVHMASVVINQNFGYIPLSLYTSGKNLRPVHVLDDITNTQPFGWNWITYDYAGKPIQMAECILPRVNLIAPNDSNFGGPVIGSVGGWTPGGNNTIAVFNYGVQIYGTPLPNQTGAPLFPYVNSQQNAYAMALTDNVGGTNNIYAVSALMPVVAGQSYTAFAYYVAGSTGRSCQTQINWYNAASGFIGQSSGTAVNDVSTGWTQVYANAVAPAGATQALMEVVVLATVNGEAHGVTCAQFALDNSVANGAATPMLAYFEPGAGPGGMRNLIVLDYDTATSQLVGVTPNNPLTYFGTGTTATYIATGMTDTQAHLPMNGLVGMVISAPADIDALSTASVTTATIAFNTGTTIILTAAGWSNGIPANASAYSIT